MRLLVAGLLALALLALPTASADSATVGLSNPVSPELSALQKATTIPVTVTLHIPGPTCQGEGTATVKITISSSGAVTSTVDVSTLTFTVPATIATPDPNNPAVPTGPQDFNGNKDINVTFTPSGAGDGKTNVIASFDGNVNGCSPQPNPTDPTSITAAGWSPAQASINVTTTSVAATPTTNTTTTPTNTTTSSTPAGTTPMSTSPVGPTVGDQTSTPPADTTPAKKGLPGPEVGLVVAAVAAIAVIASRRSK
ncbi:MAG: hypothetical protein QOE90_502 [Thermoplasmata archaeon]|jgi:hypothetical protein|nr:hypothetical protein [Thermoplasmata archaeon]